MFHDLHIINYGCRALFRMHGHFRGSGEISRRSLQGSCSQRKVKLTYRFESCLPHIAPNRVRYTSPCTVSCRSEKCVSLSFPEQVLNAIEVETYKGQCHG